MASNLPLDDHTARHLRAGWIDRSASKIIISGDAFKLRPEIDEKDISVHWLEFIDVGREKQLEKLRQQYTNYLAKHQRFKLTKSQLFGILNVGQTCAAVSEKGYSIYYAHTPNDIFDAHCGIFGLELENMKIAEILVEEFCAFEEAVP